MIKDVTQVYRQSTFEHKRSYPPKADRKISPATSASPAGWRGPWRSNLEAGLRRRGLASAAAG